MSPRAPRVLPPRTPLEVAGHAHPAADTWVLHFGWPTNPLPMNGAHGHFRKVAAERRRIRDHAQQMAAWIAKIPALGRVEVQLVWWVEDNTVRDPDNLGELAKRLYDALVRAGVVTDDRPALMTKRMPEIRRVEISGGLVSRKGFTLTITRIEEEIR